ncbi:MAG: hypothetical protein M3Q96_08700, partial [Pseudomonadota bacterium]|nr:hypothetical protein [Pseudomonadota bacterium]
MSDHIHEQDTARPPDPQIEARHAPPESPRRSGWTAAVIAVLWIASLAGTWFWASYRAAPAPVASAALPADAQLQQRVATLQMSDRISRQANRELQQ